MCLLAFEKQDLQNGAIIVFNGKQRVGKTSLMSSMICNNFKYHGKERYLNSCSELYSIGQLRGKPFNIDNVLYFTNYELVLDSKRGIKTHAIDKWDLAIPNSEHLTQYYPPYSVVGFMELDKHFNNRAWNMRGIDEANKSLIAYVSKFVYTFFATLGQHHLTLLIDYQIFEKLDSALRSLVTDCIYVLSKQDISRGFLRKQKSIYDFEWTYPQNIAFFESVAKIGIIPKGGDVHHRCRYRFIGDIHSRYDSFAYNPLYYNGLADFTYKQHPNLNWGDNDSLKSYCKTLYES